MRLLHMTDATTSSIGPYRPSSSTPTCWSGSSRPTPLLHTDVFHGDMEQWNIMQVRHKPSSLPLIPPPDRVVVIDFLEQQRREVAQVAHQVRTAQDLVRTRFGRWVPTSCHSDDANVLEWICARWRSPQGNGKFVALAKGTLSRNTTMIRLSTAIGSEGGPTKEDAAGEGDRE